MTKDEVKTKFCNDIIKMANNNGGEYIDAVIEISEKYGFGPEVGAKLLNKPIIEKIKIEGQEINLLPKMSQLPF